MTDHSKDSIFRSVLPKPGKLIQMPILKLIYSKGCLNANGERSIGERV